MSQVEHEVSSGNVYADIGFANPAEERAKAELARRISGIISRKHLDHAAAADLLSIDQSSVSMLLRGQLAGFPMETLMGFVLKLDQDIEIRLKDHRDTTVPPGIEVMVASSFP